MKEHIVAKIYTSMTGDSPFDEMMDNVKSTHNKISFRIAEEELISLEGDEGLPLKDKDLSMISEGESGMTKEEDFIDFDIIESEHAEDTEDSIIEESPHGMAKEETLVEEMPEELKKRADVDSLVMDMDEPDFVDVDSNEEAKELRKLRKKRNQEIFKRQGGFEDLVNVEDVKMEFPQHDVEDAFDNLSKSYNLNIMKSMSPQHLAKMRRIFKIWKIYVKMIRLYSKKDNRFRDAYIKAKKAEVTLEELASGNPNDWGTSMVNAKARIKDAHRALYIIK